MPEDRSQQAGLKTDPAAERLGNNAIDLANVKPASSSEMQPREGVSLISHYIPGAAGRYLFADGLPDNLGNGVLIVAERATGAADATTQGQWALFPRAVSSEYADITGFCPGTVSFTPPWTKLNNSIFN